MDHVSVGARELSRTRAAGSTSSVAAACKSRLRIALAEPLLLIRRFVPTGTTERGAEACGSLWFAQDDLGGCRFPMMKIVIPSNSESRAVVTSLCEVQPQLDSAPPTGRWL